MYKNYGLTGKTVKVRKQKLGSLDDKNEPWSYAEQKMRVEQETPYFLTCTVLPHKHPLGFGPSQPYRITVHKHDIESGEVLINGGGIR